ncbi:MAG: molybdopterin molybdotransferase MoeA [Gammaproteobacteria bacterium]|nr:molybdopterin molybdotransferase MoeA [Gammaproteobacteria bacterium]
MRPETVISTSEASQLIAGTMPEVGCETVALADCAGRVLRETIHAERDQPPFDRVTMDGIAFSYDSFDAGVRRFRIQARQHAGEPRLELADADNCIEIMTGAVLPLGCDCVIPVERIEVVEGAAIVEDGYQPERRRFVHAQGSDHRAGTSVLQRGARITPMDVAVIASCGKESVSVSAQPTIRVISTGDELIAPGQAIEAHQVRLSNGPAVVAMLQTHGYSDVAHDHLADDRDVLQTRLAEHLASADVLVLSGGVSMGKADFVPGALAELGVKVVFHKISQRPGLPMWFGIGANREAVFALPGNPVSTLVCCRQYVVPALRQASGRAPARAEYAVLTRDVTFKPQLTNFLPVKLAVTDAARIEASPVMTNTSGDFTALSGTDGYVELHRETTEFSTGSVLPLHRW